jgi:hypothetical protein
MRLAPCIEKGQHWVSLAFVGMGASQLDCMLALLPGRSTEYPTRNGSIDKLVAFALPDMYSPPVFVDLVHRLPLSTCVSAIFGRVISSPPDLISQCSPRSSQHDLANEGLISNNIQFYVSQAVGEAPFDLSWLM